MLMHIPLVSIRYQSETKVGQITLCFDEEQSTYVSI